MERGRDLGFLGPGPLRVHLDHAAGFAVVIDGSGPTARRVVDLGSGGGIPGLVLAERWPEARFVLIDAARRRVEFLSEVVTSLGWSERVRVVGARAEEAGRDPDLRGRHDLVVARGFGPPAVTAECAAPFLEVDGRLVVSEPPEDHDESGGPRRWPPEPLASLGLAPDGSWSRPFHYQALRQVGPCPDRYPRRTGVPRKRPLFTVGGAGSTS